MIYNDDEAHRAALLSDFAYGSETEAPSAARGIGADDSVLIEVAGTEVLISHFGSDIWIAFRGTTNLSDWMTNARITLKSIKSVPGRIHSGFADSTEMALSDVFEAVTRLRRGSRGVVYLCGHSKGGAEAIITAAILESVEAPIAAVHVFGAPAVGDEDFAAAYEITLGWRTFRHVFASDIVARSPVYLRFRGYYRAVGILVYLTRGGLRTFRPSPLRRLVDFVRGFSRKRGIADHGIDNYIGGTR